MFSNLNIVPIATELRTRVGDIKFGQVRALIIDKSYNFYKYISSTFASLKP